MKKFIKYQIEKLKSIKQSWPTMVQKTEQIQFGLLANKGAKKAKTKDQIQLPRNKYVFIESFLQMFYNSTSQSGRPNGQNLVFVTGAQGSGKTSMIRQSLQQFKKRKNMFKNKGKIQNQIQFTSLSSPQYNQDIERTESVDNQFYLILQFDFNNNFVMKSQAFFHHIHTQIISQILRLSTQVQNNTDTILLDCNIIKQIVLAENNADYVFVFVKDLIFSILNNCDEIRLNSQGLAKLENLNERIIQVRAQEFFYGFQNQNTNQSLFHQLIGLVSQNLHLSDLKTSILLFMSVFKRIQYEHRPIEFKNAGYQTGIQTTTFLFLILNYLCGFGSLNKKILKQWINTQNNITEQIEQKQEKKHKKKSHKKSQSDQTTDQKYHKYYVGKGNHIDVIVSFSHLQKLSCYKNPKFCSWLDNMLIQLHNQSNLRTHFPVLLELSDNYELQVIQKLGRLEINNPTVVQIPGYTRTNLFRYGPSLIFNQLALNRLRPALGRTQSLWNQAILQLSKGVKMQDITTGKAQFMKNKNLQIKFNNKINRLYLYPQNLPYIDNNTLRYHILQYLIILSKCNGFIKTWYMHHSMQLFSTQIFNQLYKEKLIYESYYNTAIDIIDMRNLIQIRSYINNISFAERIKYRLWKHYSSPHNYFFKELRYRDDMQVQQFKRSLGGMSNQRSEYMVREYFGGLRDYKVMHYQNVVKNKYKV